MIDKRVPRKLNSSKDNRIRQKDEFSDALNISITDDYQDIGGGNAAVTSDSGDAGVIKPAIGNTALTANNLFDTSSTTRRCVGSVSDTRTGVVFFFISSEADAEVGIYAIDTQGYLGGAFNTQVSIFRSPLLNFQSTSHVVGQVVHLYDENSDSEQEQFKPYLYFTDNVNEPRRLDVLRAAAAQADYANQPHNIVDFITACPKTPLFPITFQWGTALNRGISEFRSVNGFTFAYQCIYVSGEETALSTFSEIAVPPVYVQQGSSTSQSLNADNYVSLTIQKAVFGPNGELADASFNYTDEIDRIRILVREGDQGAWFVIDEVDAPEDNSDIVYDFYNDRVLTGIRVEDANKQFDNLPQMAEALAVVENRLFYGNYVEGYDNGTVAANINVSYINRPADFVDVNVTIEPVILPRVISDVNSDLAVNTNAGFELSQDPVNRISGYMIDTSQITSDIPEGAIINFSLRISPARHWHFYNSVSSYHAHQRMGVNGTATNNGTFFTDYSAQSGPYPVTPIFSNNEGVGNNGFIETLQWETLENNASTGGDGSGQDATGVTDVKLGTSAAAPLVIEGKPIEFSITAITEQDIPASTAASDLKDIICDLITGGTNVLATPVGNVQDTAGYLISQPLDFIHVTDPDQSEDLQAKHAKLKPNTSGDLNIINTVTPVFDSSITIGTGGSYQQINPCACGYFMIRNANVQFSLNREDVLESNYGDDTKGFLSLSLDFLNIQGAYDDPEPGIVTCIPYSGSLDGGLVGSSTPYVSEWRVYKYYDLIQNSTLLVDVGWDSNLTLQSDGFTPNLTEANEYYNLFQEVELDSSSGTEAFPSQWYNYSVNQRKRWIGGLRYVQGDATDGFRNNVLRTDDDQFSNPNQSPIIDFTMVDGEQGLSNRRRIGTAIDRDELLVLGPATINPEGDGQIRVMQYDENTGVEEGPYSYPQIMFGHASSAAGGLGIDPLTESGNLLYPFTIRLYTGNLNARVSGLVNSPVFSRFGDAQIIPGFFFENDSYPPAAVVNVLNANSFFTEGEDGDVVRSFKSSANHSLGIVYYDERGRSGPVAPLPSQESPSVYVAGYSNEERDGLQGRVELLVNMDTPPPPWAWSYQFVYAGNSTYDDFIQYTIGGAFVPTENVQEGKSIYLSLNYLQYNEDVSYAEAWGAFDYTGDKRFYQFVPGDYLRIISYNVNDETRVFPIDLVFEITDAVTLPDNIEENPIAGGIFVDEGAGVHPARRGSFIVVRDNPSAAGFSASDVAVGSTQVDTSAHNWNNRTVVEIVRPKKTADSEDRVYYEMGRQYSITREAAVPGVDQALQHEFNTHVIRQGDVWWRRVPVNISEYDSSSATFVNLIQEENEEELITNAPRFRDVYLESMTFNDTYSGNRVLGKGKPKFLGPQRQRVRRFSSIIFSDLNDYATKVIRFTSFNAYNMPFKDLPNEHGNINYLLNFNDSLFVVQKDKVSSIPISRDTISTATGQDSIVVSNKILGSQIHYAGLYGSDNNPESVLKVGNNIYFAHKNRGEVYKFNPSNGVQVISDKGMATHIRDDFQDLLNAGEVPKVVSGYDPLNDEYLITIIGVVPFTAANAVFTRPIRTIGQSDITGTNPISDFDGGGGGGSDIFDGAFDDPISDFDGVEEGVGNIDDQWDDILEDFSDFNDWSDEVFGDEGGGGGVVGADPPAEIITSEDTDGLVVIDVQEYISDNLSDAVGDTPVAVSGQGGLGGSVGGQYNSATKKIKLNQEYSNQFKVIGPEAQQSFAWSFIKLQSVQLPVVSGFLELAGGAIAASLGEKMYVQALNAQYNGTLLKATTRSIGDLRLHNAIENINSDVAKLPPLLQETAPDNSALQQYASDITQSLTSFSNAANLFTFSLTSETLPFEQPPSAGQLDIAALVGYGVDYSSVPRGGSFDAYLTAVKASAENLRLTLESIDPNNLLDVDGIVSNLSARISSLQSDLDIVTNQLEETSSVPTLLGDDAETFIANIASGNNNQFTLGALAQSQGTLDRQLTPQDVIASEELLQQLDFLSNNGVSITPDIVEAISNQVSAGILSQVEGTEYEDLYYNVFRTDGANLTAGNDSNTKLLRALRFYDHKGDNEGGVDGILEFLSDNQGPASQGLFGGPLVSPEVVINALQTLIQETALGILATREAVEQKVITLLGPNSSLQNSVDSLQPLITELDVRRFLIQSSGVGASIGLALAIANTPNLDQQGIPYTQKIFSPPPINEVNLPNLYQEISDNYNNA